MDTVGLKFIPYCGPTGDLLTNENHLVFQYQDCPEILFSVSRRGNAASAHFSCGKSGLRHLKQAINDFCNWVFWLFDWCEMILAQVKKESVGRLIQKCGFDMVAKVKGITVYARAIEWAA